MEIKQLHCGTQNRRCKIKNWLPKLKPAITPPPIGTDQKSGTFPERDRRLWETCSSAPMSIVGQSLPSHSAPVPTFVCSYPNSGHCQCRSSGLFGPWTVTAFMAAQLKSCGCGNHKRADNPSPISNCFKISTKNFEKRSCKTR